MTAEEIVAAVEAKGVKLRINPTDGKLTATPRRKVSADLIDLLRKKRVEVIEFLEERDGGGAPLTIEDVLPPEPPKPSIAEQLIAAAAMLGITIELDHPGPHGMLKITTPWIAHPAIARSDVITDGTVMPAEEYCNRQRSQIPTALAVQINNARAELIAHLRAPYLPKMEDLPADADPSKRSIWERLARPDNMMPGAVDNQKKIRKLLFGDEIVHQDRRRMHLQNQLDMALPTLIVARGTK